MVERMSAIEPTLLVEGLRNRLVGREEPLQVYWVRVDTGRHSYCEVVSEAVGDQPIVPVVVTIDGFHNPNAILADLVRLINLNRVRIQGVWSKAGEPPLALVLVARGSLGVPQLSSPIELPHWVPHLGGREVACVIEDAATSAVGSLNSPELRIGELREALYDLEGALLERMSNITTEDHEKGNRFLQICREHTNHSDLREFFARAEEQRTSVADPSSYRPSVRNNDSLLSLMIRVVSNSTINQLPRVGRAFMDAVGLEDDSNSLTQQPRSLNAILLRSTSPESGHRAWAADMLRVVYGAYRLSTVGSHADRYPHFPLLLLRAVSYDFRAALVDFREDLLHLSD